MAATSWDVARKAGVSRSTVSYILNGHGDRFTEQTRRLVSEAVEELGYQPQAAGRALVRGISDIVILVMPMAANTDLSLTVDALTSALAERGIALLMRSSSSPLDGLAAVVSSVRPRAVLSLTALSMAEDELLRSAGVQVYDFAAATSRPGGWNWRLGTLQAEHLVARGYRDLVYARLVRAASDALQAAREAGFSHRARELGATVLPSLTIELRADADFELLAALPSRTGIACYNDDGAAAALAAAQGVGRSIPADLAIVGADDSAASTRTTPRLTTVGYEIADALEPIVRALVTEDPGLLDIQGPELHIVQGGSS